MKATTISKREDRILRRMRKVVRGIESLADYEGGGLVMMFIGVSLTFITFLAYAYELIHNMALVLVPSLSAIFLWYVCYTITFVLSKVEDKVRSEKLREAYFKAVAEGRVRK